MRIAFFDCFSGISGNMILGALLDAGLELTKLEAELGHLGLDGYRIVVSEVQRSGIRGQHVEVEIEEQGVERHLHDIEAIIKNSELPEPVKGQSLEIFGRLARAEAKVHGEPVDHIHFHEVGAMDAIVDVVGSVTALWLLGVEQVYASRVHIGRGGVECAHGLMPVPAPATAELLRRERATSIHTNTRMHTRMHIPTNMGTGTHTRMNTATPPSRSTTTNIHMNTRMGTHTRMNTTTLPSRNTTMSIHMNTRMSMNRSSPMWSRQRAEL